MKNLGIILFSLIVYSNILNAQSSINYYVVSSSLNLRQQPNSKSEIVVKLKRYDNVKAVGKSNEGWIKVRYNRFEGYIFEKYLKKGRSVVSSYRVRTGAKCRDGSNSSATGRGACSHHGGVSYWITSKRSRVRIEN